MDGSALTIVPYHSRHEDAVITLWETCGLTRPWNDPRRDIKRMLKVYPNLFLLGLREGNVVASVMGGYDGHRGWLYYLGVHPDHRRQGCGRLMMDAVTRKLEALGCPKINLMIRTGNTTALHFYERIGYQHDPVVTVSRRLVEYGQNRVE